MQPLNVLSEMANTLKLRRLSMQGAAHDKDQVINLIISLLFSSYQPVDVP